jgi:hypothetical protein
MSLFSVPLHDLLKHITLLLAESGLKRTMRLTPR